MSGIEIASLLANLGKAAIPLLEKLFELGIVTHKGATVYYKESEIEYNFHINFGQKNTRIQSITKQIQSLIVNKIDFDEIIEISGYGLPHNENLRDLGIIQTAGSKSSIDFGRILRDVESDLIILMIRKKFPEGLRDRLVIQHINKTPFHQADQYTTADIEVALDYANLWHKSFDQFTVRNIEFSFNLDINLETIIEAIPKQQRDKIIRAGKLLSSGSKDAISFIKIMSDNFLSFEHDKIVNSLKETVILEPHENFQLTTIIPKMKNYEFAKFRHVMILPGSMKIYVGCRIEGKDIVLRGKLGVDFTKFKKILIYMMSQIEKDSKNLKI